MSGGESGATRRRYLAALSGTVCAGGLAGCGIISAGEGSSSLTAREPICDGASSAAAALYDDWFVRLRPSEVDRPALAFSSADLSVLEWFSGVSALAEPYLLYPLRITRRSALADRPLQQVTALRAPGETRAAFVAFQWPGNELDRQAWLSEFKLGFGSAGGGEFHISFEERDGKFGYERYNVADYPPARMVAYDDEHVLILPKADEAITADVETRFRRLVATRRDETRPYHCHHADARALVERLPPSDLVSARVRIDDGTLDSTTRAPDGARASAVTVRFDWPSRGASRPTRRPSIRSSTSVSRPSTARARAGSERSRTTCATTGWRSTLTEGASASSTRRSIGPAGS